MKSILRHWRSLLIGLIISLVVAETVILLVNPRPVKVEAVSSYDDGDHRWLILRIKNQHLSPIRIVGLNHNERDLPLAAYRFERFMDDGTVEEYFNAWCTATESITVFPLLQREVKIYHPLDRGEFSNDLKWKYTILGRSMIPWYNDKPIEGEFYPPRQTLPETSERARRDS